MSEQDDEMVTVPILRKFDHSEPIGHLSIRKDALPASPDFVFCLGYKAPTADGSYELIAVSISTDMEYRAYLDQRPPEAA